MAIQDASAMNPEMINRDAAAAGPGLSGGPGPVAGGAGVPGGPDASAAGGGVPGGAGLVAGGGGVVRGPGAGVAGGVAGEFGAWFVPGVRMLVAGVVLVLGGAGLVVVAGDAVGAAGWAAGLGCAVVFVAAGLALGGLTPVVPGQARVVQLFGRYRGTIREPGLAWVNPFTRRIAVSTRIRNQESAQAKVNDADGNPIEIAAVVVWQVADTAAAVYAVDDFTEFVTIQTETAVRHIASSYPYDSRGSRRAVAA